MKPAAFAIVLAVGCRPSDRERDCEEVRLMLTTASRSVMPKPKTDGSWTAVKVRDEHAFSRLREHTYRDSEVRDAVIEMVNETGWQFYTPYSSDGAPPRATARLAKLCDLPPALVLPE